MLHQRKYNNINITSDITHNITRIIIIKNNDDDEDDDDDNNNNQQMVNVIACTIVMDACGRLLSTKEA